MIGKILCNIKSNPDKAWIIYQITAHYMITSYLLTVLFLEKE